MCPNVSKPCPRMKQSPLGDDLLGETIGGRRRGKYCSVRPAETLSESSDASLMRQFMITCI